MQKDNPTPKQVSLALRCRATPGSKCTENKCPYYSAEQDETLFRITGIVQELGCDVNRIALDAADLIDSMVIKSQIPRNVHLTNRKRAENRIAEELIRKCF